MRAKACFQPGLDFFPREVQRPVPHYSAYIQGSMSLLSGSGSRIKASQEELRNFPFVDDNIIANLATELPAYLAAADGVVCLSEDEKVSGVVGNTP